MALITAAQWREHYPMLTGTDEDALIATFIDRADGLMAGFCGFPTDDNGVLTLASTTYTIRYDGPGSRMPGVLCLCVAPLISVESVTADGTALAEDTDFTVDLPGGRLGLVSGGALSRWPVGFQMIEVQFHAGHASTPPDLVAICAAQVRHLWDLRATQGEAAYTMLGGGATMSDPNALVPASVQAALAPYRVCRS